MFIFGVSRQYIDNCGDRSAHYETIGKFKHLMSDHELVSLKDIVKTLHGNFLEKVSILVQKLEKHILKVCDTHGIGKKSLKSLSYFFRIAIIAEQLFHEHRFCEFEINHLPTLYCF